MTEALAMTSPPINILKPHNIVLPQVRAALDFDHFQWELAGVF
jgi:hypothetical protein